MLFNSYQFIVFFLVVTAAFYALKPAFRWPMLLLASCYFYMVFVPKYILVLFFLILIDYAAGLLIEAARGHRRRIFLILSLVANIGMLAFFKYSNFAQFETARLASWLGWGYHAKFLDIILPIGLSFHTFQSMSYTIEVYRGAQKAERHLGIYALYVLFYPQMVAGPIERPQNLLHQFRAAVTFDPANIFTGLELMLWGLFKKMVIADNLALLVDAVYKDPLAHRGWPLILAVYAFAVQIYCDFSGYTDVARGAALVMGYRLMKNFNNPYHATTIGDFWRRWHISLSTWFRDYLYIPLGGNRRGEKRTYFNLLVVFVISGLWHGASWAFIVWGALHGFYLVFGMATRAARNRLWHSVNLGPDHWLRQGVGLLVTFHLVLLAWIFFRSGTLVKANEVFSALFYSLRGGSFPEMNFDRLHWFILAFSVIILESAHLLHRRYGLRDFYNRIPALARCGFFIAAGCWILLWGRFDSHDFIYFQF